MGNKRKPLAVQPGQKLKKRGGGSGPFKGKPQARGKKGHHGAGTQQDVPLPPAADDEEDEEQELDVDEQDVEFVQQYGRQLGFLKNLDAAALDRAVKEKQQAAAAAAAAGGGDDDADDAGGSGSDADAAEYERRPRAAEQAAKAAPHGLPVKTAAGEVVFQPSRKHQLLAAAVQVEGVAVEDSLHQAATQSRADKAAAKEAAAAEAREAAASKKAAAAAAKQQQQQQEAAQGQQGDLPPALLSLLAIRDQQQRREALKQQMALAAQHLLAAPEQHAGPGLRLLASCAADRDGYVVRLALLSLMAVFRDILPGYRIRSLTEEEAQMRVSKEVQALRDHEAALLKGYQAYLKALLAAVNSSSSPAGSASGKAGSSSSSSAAFATARVAARCMGQLLVSRPGFNYSSDLLQALVPLMVHSDAEIADVACGAVKQLLQEDVQGQVSLEAVQLVADLVRKRKCSVPPQIVSALLVLRFEQVMPTSQGGHGVGAKQGQVKKLSRKARKRKKSELDRDFEEAEAGPDLAELRLLQSQMLEALFEVFFRVLKHCSAATVMPQQQQQPAAARAAPSAAAAAEPAQPGAALLPPWPAAKVAARFPLLQPTLEGLGRYSHLISVEYFNDLMAVLQQLLAGGALPVRERLAVLLAVLDILKGHGEALVIDRRAFYNQLYQALLLVPLQVLHEPHGGKQQQQQQGEAEDDGEDAQALQALRVSLLGWDAAAAGGSGASSSAGSAAAPTSVLLLRCLEQQLLGVKQADMGRLAAFCKRLAELMLTAATPEALGLSCLLWRLVKRHARLASTLEWEGGVPVGGRTYEPDCPDPSEAGGLAAALWELPLLARHYHPHVAAAARALLALTPGAGAAQGDSAGGHGGGAGVISGVAGPQELAAEYEAVRRGGFLPPPRAPPAGRGGGRGKAGAGAGSSKAALAARQATVLQPLCNELQRAVLAATQQEQQQAGGVQPAAPQQPQLEGKKGKQQQRQQQELAAALAAAAAAGSADADELAAVEAAVRQQYALSRQHRRNAELRRELALLGRKLQLMREHLIAKQQERAAAAAAAAAQQELARTAAPAQPAKQAAKKQRRRQ